MEEIIDGNLEEYSIEGIIGMGTFSTVRLGINKKTKEKVAIKILDKSKITNERDYTKVIREMNMLKSLNHPNVIKINKICETSNYFYIIMELCENGELFDYIVKARYLNEEDASFFYYQLINGLEYIHKNNIVHRDLKPENLLLSSNNTLKIIDFGLSNYFYQNNLLTTPCGSPCYASPEMVSGQKYNGFMIDVWSSGIVLYAMVCGHLPFEDKSDAILFQKILSCQISFENYVGELSKDLINKIIVQDPSKRITLEEIKKHEFYLKGKEIFFKRFPELVEKKNVNKVINDNEAPKDSFKKKNEKCFYSTVSEARKINNFKTVQNNTKDESQKIKNITKILTQTRNKTNKSEPIDSIKNPRDSIKLKNGRNRKNNNINYTSNTKTIKKITKLKEKIGESKKNLNNELKNQNLKTLGEKIGNVTINKMKTKYKASNLGKLAKCIKITGLKKINRQNTITNTQDYLNKNSNTIIEPTNNNYIEKLTYNLKINNNDNNVRSNSVEVDNRTKFNFQKKIFSNRHIYSKNIQDINNNSFNNFITTNNDPKPLQIIGESNIIINNNNNINFNDPKLYIYIENNTDEQKESLQTTINENNNSLIENNQFSPKNINPLIKDTRISKMKNLYRDMNLNDNYTKYNNNYYFPYYQNDNKYKHRREIRSVDTNRTRGPNLIPNRFMNSFVNSNLNYNKATFDISSDYNYQMNNYLPNFQVLNNNYNKIYQKNTNPQPYFNYNINSNVVDPRGELISYDINKYNNYNTAENFRSENKNIENNFYNSYYKENNLNNRIGLGMDEEYKINKIYDGRYNTDSNYINQNDVRSTRNRIENVINPPFMQNFNYLN